VEAFSKNHKKKTALKYGGTVEPSEMSLKTQKRNRLFDLVKKQWVSSSFK